MQQTAKTARILAFYDDITGYARSLRHPNP